MQNSVKIIFPQFLKATDLVFTSVSIMQKKKKLFVRSFFTTMLMHYEFVAIYATNSESK
jgi:hypothetical protein